MRYRLWDDLGQGRPSDRRHRVDQLVLHQADRLAEQKNLHLMARLGKGIRMQKRESRFCRVVGTPCALDQYFTPSSSLQVQRVTEAEQSGLAGRLSQGRVDVDRVR